MARPKILRGTYVNLLLGDGAPVEVFNPLCGLRTKRFTHQVNTTDVYLRDCVEPEEVPIREIIAAGELWSLSGTGPMNRSQFAEVQASVGKLRNFRFEFNQPATDLVYGGYYEGPAFVTQLVINGDDEDFVQIELSMENSGPWTFVVVP